MIHNVIISLAILLLILLSAFALYLPLVALIKNKALGLKYAIPLSISVEIIIGYIFYCTSTMRFFPLFYLFFVILLNIWAYLKLRPITFEKMKIDWWVVGTAIILLISLFYTRYYDAFHFIGPGNNDTFAHLNFVKNLFNPGYLSNGYYAPGFHIILMPIAKIIPFSDLYRFTGPAIGIITVGSFILFARDWLKNKVLILLLSALLVLPIYNQFTLQTIGFFSSSLTFIYFVSFINLVADQNVAQKNINLSLFSIFSLALALTVPYLFVTIFPAIFLIFLIILIFKKRFIKGYSNYLMIINLILILGFLASIGHILMQSKVLKRYNGFPGVSVIIDKEVTTNDEIAQKLNQPNPVKNSIYLRPMYGTAYDLLRIKNVRSATSVLGIGGYLWIVFSLSLLVYGLHRKNSILVTISATSIFLGLCTQTGIFEMSTYRGRSGWYLMMLSIFGLVMFADQLYLKKMSRYLIAGCVLIAIAGFFFPPKFYRGYFNEEFEVIQQLSKQYADKNLTLIVDNYQLAMVGENITAQKLEPNFLLNANPVLILEKKMLRQDPILSQSASSTDSNFENYDKDVNTAQDLLRLQIERIKEEESFKKYSKYFENDDFTVYENIEKK